MSPRDERAPPTKHADSQSRLKIALASFATASKDAARLVAKRAEQAKILNVSLPRAHAKLGRHVYSGGSFRGSFPDIYSQIDQLHATIESIEAAGSERPAGEQFADKRIYSLLPYDDKNILIGTRNDGFYLYDGKSFTPFKTEADKYLKGNLYLPGAALKNGNFLFNTISDGVYMVDHKGKLLQKYTI